MGRKQSFYGYLAVIFSMIFWGISFVWTKQLLDSSFPVFFYLGYTPCNLICGLGFVLFANQKVGKDKAKGCVAVSRTRIL